MSKIMSNEELLEHISDALEKVENMLHSLGMSSEFPRRQKAMKVAYWLKSYSDFVLNEEKFNVNNLPSYKYRSIINVDFGFRLGSEIGGWHYAVVLDKNNSRSSDTITVVPLISLKSSSKNSKYTVILPDGIYVAYNKKFDANIAAANKLIDEVEFLTDKIKSIDDAALKAITIAEARMKSKTAREILDECTEINKQIAKLKGGTVACISQITTISKRRIVTPKSHKHILYNIRISEKEMKLIQNAIVNLYIDKGQLD